MTGCGTHRQPPGTWSDGTFPALCPAGSLSRGFNLGDIARNFIKRHGEVAFTAHSAVFDIGISAAEAVRRLKAGAAPEKAGCAGADENGNGSLMRTAPPAFFPAGKPEAERFEITRAVSSITRARPWSAAACFIYLEYLLKLLGGMEKQAACAELRGGFKGGSPAAGPDTLRRFPGFYGRI